MAFGRRDLFRLGAIGGAFGVAGALAYPMTRWFGSRSARLTQSQAGLAATQGAAYPAELPIDCTDDSSSASASSYSARFQPAPYVRAGARDALHTPPAARAGVAAEPVEFDLPIIETTLEVANNRNVRVWTYGGSVPGPIIRATLGERVRINAHSRKLA